jgi:hypothetical protein
LIHLQKAQQALVLILVQELEFVQLVFQQQVQVLAQEFVQLAGQ